MQMGACAVIAIALLVAIPPWSELLSDSAGFAGDRIPEFSPSGSTGTSLHQALLAQSNSWANRIDWLLKQLCARSPDDRRVSRAALLIELDEWRILTAQHQVQRIGFVASSIEQLANSAEVDAIPLLREIVLECILWPITTEGTPAARDAGTHALQILATRS